jgi:hypothetical protein
MSVNPSFSILVIFGLMLVAGGATSTIIVPVLANDLTPEDLLSLQDPLQEKITICHIPNGDPSKAHDITVGASAVSAHVAHGDTFGPCVTEPPPTDTAMVTVTKEVVDGPHSPEQFTICVETSDEPGFGGQRTPAAPPCAPGSGSGFTYIVKPGFIILTETQPPGCVSETECYTASTNCAGPIYAGDNIMCTISNVFNG